MDSVDEALARLEERHYVAERGLATAIYLSLSLEKPLFLEGQAGVGKTEVAHVLSRVLDTRLIRLQCYEGLDIHHAVYDWDYPRQLLYLRLLETDSERPRLEEVFSPRFLIRRPLLESIQHDGPRPPVLLLDELDRADEEFEAYLLELLGEFQITIPELGTIRAERRPWVIITSNRTRAVHDALKRRCIYHWIDYPDFEKEYRIVRLKVPQAGEALSRQVVTFVQAVRRGELEKAPGVAETLDWALALLRLDRQALDEDTVRNTLGVLIKYEEDLRLVRGQLMQEALREAQAAR